MFMKNEKRTKQNFIHPSSFCLIFKHLHRGIFWTSCPNRNSTARLVWLSVGRGEKALVFSILRPSVVNLPSWIVARLKIKTLTLIFLSTIFPKPHNFVFFGNRICRKIAWELQCLQLSSFLFALLSWTPLFSSGKFPWIFNSDFPKISTINLFRKLQ